MALLTPMTLAEAQAVGAEFALHVVGLFPIPQGSVNSNFRVELAGGGSRFLRVCEESTRDEVRAQNELLAHLVRHGVPTPAPLERVDGGGTVSEHRNKPLVVFPFVAGDWVCQRLVDAERARAIGEAVAAIHVAGAVYPDPPASRFDAHKLEQRLVALEPGGLPRDVTIAVNVLRDRLVELAGCRAPAVTPTVIHGDVFRDNVLWQGRALSAILDFESASAGHPAFDLMVTCLAWCFTDRLDQTLSRSLLGGYQSQRVLTTGEVDACYDEARAAAVRFAITRITDYELRPRGVVVFKDFRRFMGRLAAVEAIGRQAFPAWLGLQ
jgi:homoserine kinase type II